MTSTVWYFELLGRFRAESHARSIDRFRTQKTASLLAYLVLHADQPHTRESLIDLLWSDSAPEAGQTNLRVALNSLRKQLEPPGVPANSLLFATRDTVQIQSSVIDSDVAQFKSAVRRAQSAAESRDRMVHWAEAIALYKGRLLPALYDDWVLSEQRYLETLFHSALQKMIALCVETEDPGTALEYALRAVDTDLLNEDLHAEVLRLYIAVKQPTAALRHYERLAQILTEQLDCAPSRTTRAIVEPWIGALPVPPPQTAPAPTVSNNAALPSPDANPSTSARTLLPPTLPSRTGPLHGREEECERLLAILHAESTRIVTLTGPGGVGKTRLAAELSHRMAESLDGRSAFVSLAEFTDAEMIPFAILQAFQLRVPKQSEPYPALADHLGEASAVLVLDNFEQLTPVGLKEVRMLREQIPNLKLLITSRHVLGIEGEQTFPVLPLPLPEETIVDGLSVRAARIRSAQDCDALLQNAGIRLFIERAQALRPDFQITPRNADDLAAICTRLEGMPLAIELAASWINVLTPSQILERFRFSARTLGSRRRDISPRHRTVQNTVDWSYRLLSPPLQRSLRVLSTFRGGWTLEALAAINVLSEEGEEKVCSEERPHADLFEILAELQERSLIFASEERIENESRMRYRMLESVREFCADAMSAEEIQRCRERHAEYFLSYSELARQDYDTARQSHAIARLQAEHDNLVAAMEWMLQSDAPDAPRRGMKVAVNGYGMWYLTGRTAEARLYLERVLAHPRNQDPTAERATALNSLAYLSSETGDSEKALRCMEASLTIRREIGAPGPIGSSLNTIGSVFQFMGRWEEAFESYRDAVEMFREAGRTAHVAIALRNMGLVCIALGDFDGADRYVRESLEVCRRENFTHGIYTALGTLGNLDYLAGRWSLARERYEEVRDFYRETGNTSALTGLLSNLGRLYHDLGEDAFAKEHLLEAFTLSRKSGDRHETIHQLEHTAYGAMQSHPLVAVKLSGAAQAVRNAIDAPKPEADVPAYVAELDALRLRVGDTDYHAAFDAGLTMDPDDAIDFACNFLRTP